MDDVKHIVLWSTHLRQVKFKFTKKQEEIKKVIAFNKYNNMS